MKNRTVLLSAILAGTLVSCSTDLSVIYEPDAWHNAPLDMDSTRYIVTWAHHSGNGDIRDYFGTDLLDYDIPSAGSEWEIPDSLAGGDPFMAMAISRFNSYAAVHNIFSQWEQYVRETESGYVPRALSEMENIMGFKPTVAFSLPIRNAIDTTALNTCRQIGSSVFGSQEYFEPEKMVDNVLGLLAANPLANTDNRKLMDMAVSMQLSWKESSDTLLAAEIRRCTDQDSCLILFFEAMQEAPDYDTQCALAMGCMNLVPSEFVLPAMQTLLESGHYGKYSFIMWLGWRSAMQYFYFGPSRDARIADSYFNIQRRNVFLAACNYLKSHPGSFSALLTLEWLCSTGNIVRNGSNPFGNDSPLDYETVFGDR